jgi:hypothetical protein
MEAVMFETIQRWASDDEGAITVDWVVLTAAVCALVGASYWALKDNSDNLAGRAGTYLSERQPGQ